jgi:hypothetical protein
MQLPLLHWLACEHAAPRPTLPTQLGAVQNVPVTQLESLVHGVLLQVPVPGAQAKLMPHVVWQHTLELLPLPSSMQLPLEHWL